MKKTITILLFAVAALTAHAQTADKRPEILLETDSGNIRIQLYNETPKHRDNFIKQVKAGAYDGVLFHRVIKDFMIQTGDLGSKTAKPGQMLGDTPEEYTIPAEIHYPQLLHKRGAVAAARESDEVNPQRASSSTQFYIVWGIKFSDKQLDWAQSRLNHYTDSTVQMSPETRELYKTVGGTPNLDGTYTVFGEVVEGLEIVNRIEQAVVDDNDRPLADIHIRKASIVVE